MNNDVHLRIGVDMIGSSEEPLPQSGLGGVYNRLLAGTGPRTSPREPVAPSPSPADLPPLKGWRPREVEEVAALRVGRDAGGAGGRGAGCAADGRGGREGGAAALGGGGLKTWEIKNGPGNKVHKMYEVFKMNNLNKVQDTWEARCAVLCQFKQARWKPGSTYK